VTSVDNEPERPKLPSQYRQPPKDVTKKGSVITKSCTDQLAEADQRRRERRALDQATSRSIDTFADRDDTPEPEGGATSAVEPNPDRQSSQATTFFASFRQPPPTSFDPPPPIPESDMAPPEPQATNNFSLVTMTPVQLQELIQRTVQQTTAAMGPPPAPQDHKL